MGGDAAAVQQHQRVAGAKPAQVDGGDVTAGIIGAIGRAVDFGGTSLGDILEDFTRGIDAEGRDIVGIEDGDGQRAAV